MKKSLMLLSLFAFVFAAGCCSCPSQQKGLHKQQAQGQRSQQGSGHGPQQGDRQGPPPQFEGR